jgi:cytochrome c556
MIRTALAMAIVAAGVAVVAAQSDPITARRELMKSNGDHVAVLTRMSRGEEPFDADKVAAAFKNFGETAEKTPELFAAPPPRGADTKALPRIWQAKADFAAKNAAFAKAVNDNKDRAKSARELRTVLERVTDTCGYCHERYRRPDPPARGRKT